MKKVSISFVAVAALTASAAALTHHSPAVFDRSQQVTIAGVVKEFRWGNPHSWIHVDVASGGDLAAGEWSVEMDPASHLARRGWRSTTLKAGDRIEVLVYPLRNDEKGGQYIAVTLPDGRVMSDRGTPEVIAPPE